MKFTIQRDSILKPLQFAAGVVEKRQTMPILSNVLVDVQQDGIILTGSDTEVEMIGRCSEGLEVQTPGRATIPARKFLDICKSLPEGSSITVELDKTQALVTSGKSKFFLATIDAKEYPNLDHQESTNKLKLPQNSLKLLAQRTYFAMAQQDVRYYLNGMLLEINDQGIRAVATDGHRLAMNSMKCPQTGLNISALIPRKAVIELMRLLDDSESELDISISPNHIRAENEEFTFTSKLLEGNYPNYESVIPKNGDKSIVMDKDILRQSLFRASILTGDKYRGVQVNLDDNIIRIRANNPEQEQAYEEISIDYNHEQLELGLNVDYLIDILNTISDQTVRLTFSNNNTGVLIDETVKIDGGKDGCESVFVVMPIRL